MQTLDSTPDRSITTINNDNDDDVDPHNSHSDSESDYSDSVTDPNGFYGEDQMNFVTDLFGSCEEYLPDDPGSVSDPFLESANNEISEEIRLGLGFGIEFNRMASDDLRVVGIESDSDTEELDPNSGSDPDSDSDMPVFWNCLRLDDQRAGTGSEEFEWEEVDGRVDEREGLSSVIDRIEEISVSSEISSVEDADEIGVEVVRNLEWEVLLAVNNLERSLEFRNDENGDGDGDGDGVLYLAAQDDYFYTAEYDTLFGQFMESESAMKGSPPAAKSVVENLPSVMLKKEDLGENIVVCAVCKDEIFVEEKVTRLPCCHHYHGDCIVPWLSIRNTCPVCRFELPTDDADYEQRKNRRGVAGLLDDLQVRYNFELLP